MKLFETMATKDYEQVLYSYDKESGLKCIIAIHDTTLGPALGGCRFWHYETEEAALADALRLARGMTYKASVAGLNLGGGKAVIIGDSKTMKTEQLFRAFGRFVQSLSGRYITAEDVGTSVEDMTWVSMETEYVTGTGIAFGGSGDPSPVTAYGVYHGMRAAQKWHSGSESLAGKTICVQGIGHVGFHLLQHLIPAGAKVIATDIDESAIKKVAAHYPTVEFVRPEAIYEIPCDIFAPCALGGIINDKTIPLFKCPIIAGSANNILGDEERHSLQLRERGIVCVPDFVISAGGLINVANELLGYNKNHALAQAANIYDIVSKVLTIARNEHLTNFEAANRLAERRIQGIGNLKGIYNGAPFRRSRGVV